MGLSVDHRPGNLQLLHGHLVHHMMRLVILLCLSLAAGTTVGQTATDSIPEYKEFSQFAPWLSLDNDTTYVINFWATWCKPCVAELPFFIELADQEWETPVAVILVSLDFPGKIQTRVRSFLDDRGITLPVIALTDTGSNEWIPQVSSKWSGAIPATLIYRSDQRQFHEGDFASTAELATFVKRFIASTSSQSHH